MPQDSRQSIYIDAKGLKCPMPVIKLQQAIRSLEPNCLVTIDCTDKSAEQDIASWCQVNKHLLQSVKKHDFGLEIVVLTFGLKS